jgi:hypothetical protein
MVEEAILTTTFVLNRVVTMNKDVTSYEGWNYGGRISQMSIFCVLGVVWQKSIIPAPKKGKLVPKTIDCVFLGYAHNNTTYKFLVVKFDTPDVSINTIMESHGCFTFEDVYRLNSRQQ